LRFSTGFRVEDADTKARGSALSGNANIRIANSDLEEVRVAESFGLVYSGIPRTTLSATADLEQRELSWSEYFDARSHEIVTDFGRPVTFMAYDADIDHTDQTYTLRVVNRPVRWLKWILRYRQKDKVRDYTTRADTAGLSEGTSLYPGVLGDQDQDSNEVSFKFDIKCPKNWLAGFQYEHVNDDIAFGNIAETAQKLRRNRLCMSLFGPITQKLSLLMTSVVDSYKLETPTNGGATNKFGKAGLLDLKESDFDVVAQAPLENYIEDVTTKTETQNPILLKWYSYNYLTHKLTAKKNVYAVRTADSKFAKVQFMSFYCENKETGCIKMRYSYQGNGSNSFLNNSIGLASSSAAQNPAPQDM